jgi:hypothetical protein
LRITTDASNVYWVEQVDGNAGAGAGYNGEGTARVLRVPKKKGGAVAELATGQSRASSIQVDGSYVYWPAETGPGTSSIFRVARDCTPPCPPPEEWVKTDGVRINHLVHPRSGLFFAGTNEGRAVRIDLVARAAQVLGLSLGGFSSVTASDTYVYYAGISYPAVARVSLDGDVTPQFAPIPQVDGGQPGFFNLAADCTDVWARTGLSPDTVKLARITPSGQVTETDTSSTASFYDLGVDARFVYFSAANIGGVLAYDKVGGGALARVYDGNVFALAVDDDGLYWGEHGGALPGALYMMVK